MTEQAAPVFTIEKIYVKDLSVEIPNAPAIFLEREQPNIEVQINTDSSTVNEGIFENTITVTVTAKINDKTLFLVECTQAGIFQIRNVPEADLETVLGIGCPNIIFPYLRETISDVVTRAGFPPLLMAPVNFEALYVQRKEQAAAESSTSTH